MGLVHFGTLIFLVLCCAVCVSELIVRGERRGGRYPAKGTATLEDVRRLVREGELTLAMRAYREVTGASLKEAKEFVEAIQMRGKGGDFTDAPLDSSPDGR